MGVFFTFVFKNPQMGVLKTQFTQKNADDAPYHSRQVKDESLINQ